MGILTEFPYWTMRARVDIAVNEDVAVEVVSVVDHETDTAMDSRMMIERYYSVTEISEQFRLSRQTIWKEINSGRLAAVKITDGSGFRISEQALRAWLAQRNPAA